jgi:hypothetical protein
MAAGRWSRSLWAALGAAALALVARADVPAGAHMLELRGGSVKYTVIHKFHEVTGTSDKLEGRALALADGSAKVEVRAPIASFDSGNSNRDAHMREATHELQHPYVRVKCVLQGVALPLSAPLEKSAEASVELNGERQSVPVQLQLSPEGSKVHVHFTFPISLDAFKVERPELMLIKVDDQVKIEGDALFEALQ